MELRYLQSPAVSSIPPNRSGLIQTPFLCGQISVKLPRNGRYCFDARRRKFPHVKVQSVSGTAAVSSGASKAASEDLKGEKVAFVAGATGRVGSRTVREVLKLGFRVRAGVRNSQKAESLVESVRKMKLEEAAEGSQPIDKLEIVECDLEKSNQIGAAIGDASIVICCIGASEKEVFDVTGPYRIDYLATKNLIDAAASAKVNHFILLTSLGTNKVGFPAAVLNLFWGVLCWKRRAEEALLASGLPYTIVRPGGMERPTDTYKETHNITLSQEDTLFGGQVSNLQVAELMAYMAKNRHPSYCKVVEVVAETTAPLTPLGDLLKRIPSQRGDDPLAKESKDGKTAPAIPESISSEISSTSAEKEPIEMKAAVTRPLSPYTMYEDLKPPTSPTPTPSVGSGATNSGGAETPVTTLISSSVQVTPEATSASETEDLKMEKKKTNSSSPYIMYEDFKPPLSSTPNPPSSHKELFNEVEKISTSATIDSGAIKTIGAEADSSDPESIRPDLQMPQILSPYTAYEDLKPPSSPTPTPSSSKERLSDSSSSAEVGMPLNGENGAPNTTAGFRKDSTQSLASYQSPYIAYDDLKPPTSPSPSVPILSAPVQNEAVHVQHHCKPKPEPLSPYTMYEDLKPPSSPTPLAPKNI